MSKQPLCRRESTKYRLNLNIFGRKWSLAQPSRWPVANSLAGSGPLDGASAVDQSDDEQHERDHEQHVDEVAKRVAAHYPEKPQNQQNHRNRKKHHSLLAPTREHGACPPDPDDPPRP